MRSKALKTPALVVTLGTTASISAMEICEQMLTLDQDDRDAMAIVTIDTDTSRPQFQNFLDANPGKFHTFKAPIRVPPNVDSADFMPPYERRHVFIPSYVPRYFDYGAGGIRNNGHVALAFRQDEVRGAIQEALSSIKLLRPGIGQKVSSSVQVYLVAFLGGGTGSGIVADLAVMLRDMLNGDQDTQRLILFGILPSDKMPGSSPNEESWRRSNATAALFEIMATGLAAGQRGKEYQKRLLINNVTNIPFGPIFNETFLIGKTNLGDVAGIARMVGLDLYQRITDASGIGNRERSQAPDFKDLQGADDRGLPTNFSASCPIEVRFPALEAAQAFAEVAAGRMLQLPDFVGKEPPYPRPTDEQRRRWLEQWQTIAIPRSGPADDENDTAVETPREFSANELFDVGPDQRDFLWSEVVGELRRIPLDIERRIKEVVKREQAAFADVPPAAEDEQKSYTSRQLTHLALLEQEYSYVLESLRHDPPPPPPPGRPVELEGRLDSVPPLGPLRNYMMQGRAQNVADAYNQVIRDTFFFQRHRIITDALDRLYRQAHDLYESGKAALTSANPREAGSRLLADSFRRRVWMGEMPNTHQHQISLFALNEFHTHQAVQESNGPRVEFIPAMEGLFRLATMQGETLEDGDQPLGDCTRRNTFDLDTFLRTRWMDRLRAHLNAARHISAASDLDGSVSDSARQDALAQDAARLPDRTVEFFREEYLAWFYKHNLFDLLEIGHAADQGISLIAARRKTVGFIRAHLDHATGILREMIVAEPSLWSNGAKAVRPTLYLSINQCPGTQQSEWIKEAAQSIPNFTTRLAQPIIDEEIEPHRMQLNYAVHALSIRTMPMFFMPNNSLTSEYLRNQRSWYGDGRSSSAGGSYGIGRTPVHNSEEMERLVLDRQALPNRWKLSLVERVLRSPSEVEDAPNWNTVNDPQDYWPGGFGAPGAPGGPDSRGGHTDQTGGMDMRNGGLLSDEKWRNQGFDGPNGPQGL